MSRAFANALAWIEEGHVPHHIIFPGIAVTLFAFAATGRVLPYTRAAESSTQAAIRDQHPAADGWTHAKTVAAYFSHDFRPYEPQNGSERTARD